MEVIDIVEQDDGSAIVTLELGSEAIRLFVQKAFVDILAEMMIAKEFKEAPLYKIPIVLEKLRKELGYGEKCKSKQSKGT